MATGLDAVLSLAIGAAGGVAASVVESVIAARREAARLWVTVELDEQLRITNYGRSSAYEVVVAFSNLRAHFWDPSLDVSIDVHRVLARPPFRWNLEFPLTQDADVEVDLEAYLVQPLLESLYRLPEWEVIGDPDGHRHITASLQFDVEYSWIEPGGLSRRSRTREGIKVLVGVACGYDTLRKTRYRGAWTLEPLSVYPPGRGGSR